MKQMRRQECLMDAQWAQELIASCEYAYLATAGADGTPYCIAGSPVTGGGTAQVVQDAGQKRMALTKLCEKYAPNEPAGSIRRELDALLGKTAVVRISDLEYSGKSKYGK
mgnify:CR=1 FL=1